MPWLEMTRTPELRKQGWGLGDCLSSPQRNDNGGRWAFWETMLLVRKDDLIFHLAGKSPHSFFVGTSVANNSAENIIDSPEHYSPIYKVELDNYRELSDPLNWDDIKREKDGELRNYFIKNKNKGKNKERLFYVIQNNKLRCLNGAYLSYLSDDLIHILFDLKISSSLSHVNVVSVNAKTSSRFSSVSSRLGQDKFSKNIKDNFNHSCCFPDCSVDHDSFLIGAHIARWTDVPELRGNTSNGLCLCNFHDKAFEIGAFTIDSNYKVVLRDDSKFTDTIDMMLNTGKNKQILNSEIKPSIESLKYHWIRHGFKF